MSRLDKFRHQPAERKRYVVGYSEWLSDGETISTVSVTFAPTTVPPLALTGGSAYVMPDGKSVYFNVEGGLDDTEYEATIRVTTTDDQLKEDEIVYIVEEQTYIEVT